MTNSLAGLPTSSGVSQMGSIDACTITCTISDMPTFTISFRRPETAPPNRTASITSRTHYDGSYGFDWLRYEYVYDVVEIAELGIDPVTRRNRKSRLYRGNIDDLLNEYLQLRPSQATLTASAVPTANAGTDNTLAEVQNIKTTLGKTYIPAWLAIFPTTHTSGINSNGVDLYLEVEQEKAIGSSINGFTDPSNRVNLTDIEISFEADAGITVTATGISTLSDLVTGATPVDQQLNFDNSTNKLQSKNVKRYKDINKKVNIKCDTASNDVRFVKVIAKDLSKNCERPVGLLCIYPNGTIKQSDITVVPTIIPNATSVTRPLNRSAVDTRVQKQFLNQASVYANITTDAPFDINGMNNTDRTRFDTEMISHGLTTRVISSTTTEEVIPSNNLSNAHTSIVTLYGKTNSNIVLNDDNDGQITYLFFTNYVGHGGVLGNAHVDIPYGCTGMCPMPTWGNTTVIYKDGLGFLDTVAHELGHSFSLPHTFEESQHADVPPLESYYLTHHTFYRGYTDNLMDYRGRVRGGNNTYMRIALFKWQWNIIRDDRSMT